jgi:methyl-accepting chemotaxis protein
MKMKDLMDIIREEILNEFQLDKSILEKVDEFGELSDEMDKVKKQLDEMKKKYEGLEDELRPLLEELNRYNQKSIQTEKYLVSIKRFGYEKENMKYKEVFEQSLTKVNKNTKKLLEDLLQSTKTISQVVTSIGVQKIGEGFFSDFVNKIKTLLNKLTNSVKRSSTDMDDLILISKKLYPKDSII